jgi:PAS domain S-box-containing protein
MSNSLRLILVDDNPDDCALVMRELRREFPDLQVRKVTEAESFARVLEVGDFDLVITDYQLLWTNGLAVLHAVKERWPDCPVIMFTATGSEEVAVEAMKAGLDDYVLKSLKHLVRLSAAVRSALERVRERQAAKEAEARYRRLFDGVPVGLYRTTPTGQIVDANPTLVEMLGYPDREALLTVNAADLYLNPEERQRWQALMEGEGIMHAFETQFHRRDGTIIWVEDHAQAIRGANDRVLYYEGSLQDITARVQAEEKLKKYRDHLEEVVAERTRQLQEVNAELESFAYSVSHDLRAPLRAIHGFARALLEDYANRLDPAGQEYARRIVAAAGHMDTLIKDLLSYSQLSRADLHLQPVSLASVVADVLAQLEAELREREVQVTVEKPLPQVVGHHATLIQVVTNLLTNAVKFVASGTQPQVRVWAETSDGWVRLWVEDNGIGIAPENQERIFRVFERLHGIETFPGTGIGLAIVRKGMERMGGNVGVESELGQGSRFWVELPKVENGL